jgi:probable HAF family extracellular repeat protein
MFRKAVLSSLIAAALAAPATVLADPMYSATFLPDGFSANKIGAGGQVIGSIHDSDQWRAATWQNGTLTSFPGNIVQYSGISSNGMLTGSYSPPEIFEPEHAFIYANGNLQDIGTLNGYDTRAYAINASGQVAGDAMAPGYYRAFLYSNGRMTDLGTFGGAYASASAINDAGVVVGAATYADTDNANGATHAFIYCNGVLTDLGSVTGGDSWAEAVNASGDVVGESWETDPSLPAHAFLYSRGVMADLGTLGGIGASAYDINASGDIVGGAATLDDYHAFIYRNGRMLDLNDMITGMDGYTVSTARSINDAGQILAWACQGGFNCRDVVLDPISAVPEPATCAMLMAGLAGLLGRRRAGRPHKADAAAMPA